MGGAGEGNRVQQWTGNAAECCRMLTGRRVVVKRRIMPRRLLPIGARLPTRLTFSRMADQTYDEGRAKNLQALLLALADRIRELNEAGTLLQHAPELTRLIGEVRSELFHYEVRATYDTPEVAENRRIVSEAKQKEETEWQPNEWKPEEEDDPEW